MYLQDDNTKKEKIRAIIIVPLSIMFDFEYVDLTKNKTKQKNHRRFTIEFHHCLVYNLIPNKTLIKL